MTSLGAFDLVVVGSGIVGLGHALEAHRRGLSVAVVDRSSGIHAASVRNFGHIGVTGQSGVALERALVTRDRFRWLHRTMGLPVSERGAIVAARSTDELELLAALATERADGSVRLLDRDAVLEHTPVRDATLTGGAHLTLDLQVDPRTTAPRIAEWLSEVGVRFFVGTAVLGVDTGVVHTARGSLSAAAIVVAVGVDVDQFYPELAASAGIRRCGLDMMSLDWSGHRALELPLLTGSSLLRYSAFAGLDGAAAVRARYERDFPHVLDLDINQMYTQRPDGSLIVGDTHYRADAIDAFQSESSFDTMLALTRELFGVARLTVRERWQGVYATAAEEFFLAAPADGVRVVSVTTGIGMTTGLGLGAEVVTELTDSL